MHSASNGLIALISQLAYSIPIIIVCTVGALMAVLNMNRHRGPCTLVLSGCLLYLFTTLGHAITQAFLIRAMAVEANSAAQLGRTLGLLGILAVVLHTVALALLIAAAFNGRQNPIRSPQL